MPSTFVNPVVNPDIALGVATLDETAPVRHWPAASVDETDVVIRAIYKQVLGNAYVMESERQQIPESQFRQGQLSVAEFIRQVAKSDLYRSRFFENGSRNRFIELNFKHFLGRAPESVAEIAAHSAILDGAGYEAEIDAYLDSNEYTEAFGSDTVPYHRGYKTEAGTKLVGFTHIFPLLRGASSSDKNVMANNPARLNRTLFSDRASQIVPPSGATNRQGSGASQSTEDMLRSLFNTPAASRPATDAQASDSARSGISEQAKKAQSQAAQIEQLRQQLNELRSLSDMGSFILRKGQRLAAVEVDPYAAKPGAGETSTLEQQADTIKRLQGELMSAQSQSSIAEYKLNKWRRRSY
ncbi:MAG: phycobilisome rod-core linker polypeptide [Phormidesmis sp.]